MSRRFLGSAMTRGHKHGTGPVRTTDVVGLDVRMAIAEHLAGELSDRFGHVGRRCGQVFYTW